MYRDVRNVVKCRPRTHMHFEWVPGYPFKIHTGTRSNVNILLTIWACTDPIQYEYWSIQCTQWPIRIPIQLPLASWCPSHLIH